MANPISTILMMRPSRPRSSTTRCRRMASLANDLVVPAYDFAGSKLIADVGGGHGRLMSAILRSTPHGPRHALRPAFRRRRGRAGARRGRGRGSLRRRGRLVHGFGARRCRHLRDEVDHPRLGRRLAEKILRNIRTAIAPNGRLLLLELVLPERATANWGAVLDMEMLVTAGGRERTRAEFANLLARCGFRLTQVVEPRRR